MIKVKQDQWKQIVKGIDSCTKIENTKSTKNTNNLS